MVDTAGLLECLREFVCSDARKVCLEKVRTIWARTPTANVVSSLYMPW